MTDREIVERAKKAEKRTCFGELVHSPISKGVNSAFGIGFIEGMAEYRNSLQEEPVSEELEEASKRYALNNTPYEDCADEMQEAFKAGAQWQKNKNKASVSEDLEKFAENESIDYRKQRESCGLKDPITLNEVEEANYNGIMAGAQWQKEQMMKSVLASQEMTCIQVAHRLIGSSWNLACPTDKIGLKSNDKVKVIIIKD